ncbi:hypothetical protein WAI453_001920 [Rhynchosporium graminicola]|uniref:Uncharacterized protein n=1 Tax=Rhynchosporium graminicola TaxID=2792576 RepID=A0A1E1KKU3_9HELO|nr:uncharacterized protein RCO7_06388 [Rhynchosporium commune]
MSLHEDPFPNYTNLFGDFHFGNNARSQAYESIPESPLTENAVLRTQLHLAFNPIPASSPPTNELAAVSLRSPKCPQCKGTRFDFTSYFHNARIFRSPPHELLNLVERSYVLKNRLQSLLVTYIINDLREEIRIQDIRHDIIAWVQEVANLADQVREIMDQAEGVSAGLYSVQMWTGKMASQLESHLERSNGLKMDVQKGWKKGVLFEFRKKWEIVWVVCANACSYQ